MFIICFFLFSVLIKEEVDIDTSIKFLSVIDEDDDKNGEFDCSLESFYPQDSRYFYVITKPTGCDVKNKVTLKWFKKKSVYILRVKVSDRASRETQKTDVFILNITVM